MIIEIWNEEKLKTKLEIGFALAQPLPLFNGIPSELKYWIEWRTLNALLLSFPLLKTEFNWCNFRSKNNSFEGWMNDWLTDWLTGLRKLWCNWGAGAKWLINLLRTDRLWSFKSVEQISVLVTRQKKRGIDWRSSDTLRIVHFVYNWSIAWMSETIDRLMNEWKRRSVLAGRSFGWFAKWEVVKLDSTRFNKLCTHTAQWMLFRGADIGHRSL